MVASNQAAPASASSRRGRTVNGPWKTLDELALDIEAYHIEADLSIQHAIAALGKLKLAEIVKHLDKGQRALRSARESNKQVISIAAQEMRA